MYNSFEKKYCFKTPQAIKKIYKSTRLGLRFFSFSTKDLDFFIFEVFPEWEKFTKSKNRDLEKITLFFSILSKKERIKTITYVFKR